MNAFLDSVNIYKSIIKWKKHLLIVGGVALLASAIFSGPAFIKPRFKSFAILYPANLIPYSEESPTEQMLQLLESADIRDSIIQSFSLLKHYDIDPLKNKTWYTTVVKQFEENVSINKTEYESVEVIIWDTDPALASVMVDSMITYMNAKARSLQQAKSKEILVIAKRRMELKKIEMDSLENVVKDYRQQYGLLDYAAQSKEYSKAYTKALSSGSQRAIAETKTMLTTLADRGGEFMSLTEHLWRVRGTFNDLKLDYENSLKDISKVLTYENIVTKPLPADKKSSPIRWLIVLVSVMASEFIAFLVLLLFETRAK